MMLYYGSYLEIKEPDLTHSRSNVDENEKLDSYLTMI